MTGIGAIAFVHGFAGKPISDFSKVHHRPLKGIQLLPLLAIFISLEKVPETSIDYLVQHVHMYLLQLLELRFEKMLHSSNSHLTTLDNVMLFSGIETHLLVNLTGLNPPGVVTEISCVNLTGETLFTGPAVQDAQKPYLYSVGPFIPPDTYFFVKVIGKDDAGWLQVNLEFFTLVL